MLEQEAMYPWSPFMASKSSHAQKFPAAKPGDASSSKRTETVAATQWRNDDVGEETALTSSDGANTNGTRWRSTSNATIEWILSQSEHAAEGPPAATTPPSHADLHGRLDAAQDLAASMHQTVASQLRGSIAGNNSLDVPASTPPFSHDENCRTVAEGDPCWGALRWAVRYGIIHHPDWYPNLTRHSSMREFQTFLHLRGEGHCPRPCTEATLAASGQEKIVQRCRAVQRGSLCDEAVRWAMNLGIALYPQWYPGLSKQSSFEEFQALLQQRPSTGCPPPCPADSSIQQHDDRAVDPQIPGPTAAAGAVLQVPGTVTRAAMTSTKAMTTEAPTPPLVQLPAKVSSDLLEIPPPLNPLGPKPRERVIFMYRAQSDADYPIENVNAADLMGVLWYLHNEVVPYCPRKYGITRILRLKVTLRNPMMPYVAFDYGQCTMAHCGRLWREHGFAVGCQNVAYGADLDRGHLGLAGHWYSLPGPCPSQDRKHKDASCRLAEPGGACQNVTGRMNCMYHVEHAGEVRLDELEGIADYKAFCRAGNLEYSKVADRGRNLSFWDGKTDLARCRWRYNTIMRAFRMKYPKAPNMLGWYSC